VLKIRAKKQQRRPRKNKKKMFTGIKNSGHTSGYRGLAGKDTA
jgi:hypothetical protein